MSGFPWAGEPLFGAVQMMRSVQTMTKFLKKLQNG